ncbi:neuronal acetylcholine receptor subunit alpha-10-like [Acropora palmata]|uniref:neuronal acetylcholine receptor subunit alpha-10-like n=1 Tax=Acropora palmata TaxID=6131 RepID=UPI003DA056ED
MKRELYTLAIQLLAFLLLPTNAAVMNDEQYLLRDLFHNYSKSSRPVLQRNAQVVVTFRAKLKQIIDLKDNEQLLQVILYTYQGWNNPLLIWNASHYGGIDEINVDSSRVWVPDIVLYNSAEFTFSGGTHKYKTDVVIYSNGDTIWLAPAMFVTVCQLDVRFFPFDEQKCRMKFGSWTHDESRVDMRIFGNASNDDIYTEHGEWQLLSINQKRTSKMYDCCPKPYVDITYTIHLRRRSLFYTLYLIVPALIITAMVLVGFFLPPESGERMQLGITVLLAMIVFLQLVYQNLPSTSNSAPLLGKFYIITMLLISLSLAATCLVLNYWYGRHGDGEMPMWVRLIILDCLGRVFGSYNKHRLGNRRRIVEGQDVLMKNEWKTAANILDKFFMAFFAFLITITSISLFFQAPFY